MIRAEARIIRVEKAVTNIWGKSVLHNFVIILMVRYLSGFLNEH